MTSKKRNLCRCIQRYFKKLITNAVAYINSVLINKIRNRFKVGASARKNRMVA